MVRAFIFFLILSVGWPIIWAFLSYAQKHERVSFFGFHPMPKGNNPEKFARVVRSYKLQMVALPIVAALVAAFIEIPE